MIDINIGPVLIGDSKECWGDAPQYWKNFAYPIIHKVNTVFSLQCSLNQFNGCFTSRYDGYNDFIHFNTEEDLSMFILRWS